MSLALLLFPSPSKWTIGKWASMWFVYEPLNKPFKNACSGFGGMVDKQKVHVFDHFEDALEFVTGGVDGKRNQ